MRIHLYKIGRVDVIATAIVSLYFIWLFQAYAPHKNNRAIIHDVTSYYSYLPAIFIYQDPGLNFADTLPQGEPLDALWYNVSPEGIRYQKMTLGLLPFYLPGFLVADAYVQCQSKWNRNGFSYPYQLAMSLSTLIAGILGFWFLRKLLSRYFHELVSGITILSLGLASNLPYYISLAPGLSHPFSFLILVMQALLVLRINQKSDVKSYMALGVLTAWVVLIRPTSVLPALLPLFLLSPLRWKEIFKLSNLQLIAAVIGAFLVFLPQMLYWKAVSGSYIFYSYDHERFFFHDSKILKGLFGFRKGWFIYTPLMLFAVVSIPWKRMELRPYAWFFLISFPVFVYWVFSWWCWWYGGSYGSRVMIEYYVVLAIFLANGWNWVTMHWRRFLPSLVILYGLMVLNHKQLYQYHHGILHWDSMTFRSYKAIFMRSEIDPEYQKWMEAPDYEAAKRGEKR